jgi:ATP-binding cassette subfamily C (CFTR/MRP) protein 4
MGSMDELLPPAFFDVLTVSSIWQLDHVHFLMSQIGLNIVGILAVIFAVRPWVILPTVILGVLFVFLRRFYMASARDIKRIEGIAKSPVFSQLSTSLHGLTTIRAFAAQPLLRAEFDRLQDLHTSAWFAFISATRWFGVWLDWIVVVYLGLVVYSFLLLGDTLPGGEVGLAISSCIMLTGMLQWGVRQSAEVENLMTSVERVMEYSRLEPEAAPTKPDKRPLADWPESGQLEFTDVALRYAEEEKDVLRGLTFKTEPREKVGIVGRTGAGKSSLVAALFRLAEPRGSITIDGVEVLEMGLEDLRAKISIIPQDPLVFTGTMRRNLDPFSEHGDEALWRVLQEVHLADAVRDLKDGLATEMSEGGSNLSVGQRQLLCLARAVLRRNRILVMDEATANVDPRTDALIQEQIREKFRDCTVLTIAHRLHTIMDCDRILVLSDGQVAEFGRPYELLCERWGVAAHTRCVTLHAQGRRAGGAGGPDGRGEQGAPAGDRQGGLLQVRSCLFAGLLLYTRSDISLCSNINAAVAPEDVVARL